MPKAKTKSYGIYRALYPGSWEVEVRVDDALVLRAHRGEDGAIKNICIQVRQALTTKYRSGGVPFIEWSHLNLTRDRDAR